MDITLLAPGSPDTRHERDMQLVSGRLKVAGHNARACYLDHCAPRPAAAAARLATREAPTTVVVPMVSTLGLRMRADVTAALRAMRTAHPTLLVGAAQPIGVHPLLLDAAAELLHGVGLAPRTGIILATAGLRDARTLAALDTLVREQGPRLAASLGARAVRTAHLDGGRPLGRTRTLLRRLDGCDRAVAVPLVVTEGLLSDRITRAADRSDMRLAGGSLAHTRALADLVVIRARATQLEPAQTALPQAALVGTASAGTTPGPAGPPLRIPQQRSAEHSAGLGGQRVTVA